MTDVQKTAYFKSILGETITDALALAYLKMAEQKILNRIYPFGRDPYAPLETRYAYDQCELAVILYNMRGAEGESAHDENGISRKYSPEEQFMQRFLPRAKVCL